MGKLSDDYGITAPGIRESRANPKGSASKGALKPDKPPKPPRVERTATPSVKKDEPPHLGDEVVASAPGEKVNRARKALGDLPLPSVHFLMKISPEMSDWLEVARAKRGLRSRVETIRAILSEARGK